MPIRVGRKYRLHPRARRFSARLDRHEEHYEDEKGVCVKLVEEHFSGDKKGGGAHRDCDMFS